MSRTEVAKAALAALYRDFGEPAVAFIMEHLPGATPKQLRASLDTLIERGHPEVRKSAREAGMVLPKASPPTVRAGQSKGDAALEVVVRKPRRVDPLVTEFGAAEVKRARALDPTATPAELRQTLINLQGAPSNKVWAQPRTEQPSMAVDVDPGITQRGGEMVDAIPNLTVGVTPKRFEEPNPFNIFDHEGREVIISMADRSAGGDAITHLNNIELKTPVDRLGGQEFIHDPHSPDAVWANDLSGVTKHMDMARASRLRTGQDPLFMPFTMSTKGINFSHMPRTLMLAHEAATLNPYAKRQLNQRIRDIVGSEFRDMDDPDSIAAFMRVDTPAQRKALNLLLHNRWESGGLGFGPARVAATDLAQMRTPMLDLRDVGLIDARGQPLKSNHPSFPIGLPGSSVGRLDSPVAALSLLPDEMAGWNLTDPRAFLTGVNEGEASVPWSMQLNPRVGQVTDKVLRGIERRGYACGGPVRSLAVRR